MKGLIRHVRAWIIGSAAVLAVALAAIWVTSVFTGRLLRPYTDAFAHGDLSGWKTYGGSWAVNDGILDNISGARGDKAVTGSSRWTDYIVETDVRLNADPADSLWGDAGLILRVTDPALGVDSYDGYYVGIGSDVNLLLLGRANYSWARLSTVPLGVPARRGSWFHLRVLAKGCYFEASAEDLATHKTATLNYFDRDCSKLAGAAGVRTFGMPASWRGFTVRRPDR